MFAAWAAESPWAICLAMRQSRGTGIGPCSSVRSAPRLLPSRNSIDEVRRPVGQLAEVADVDDVLVADGAGRARLLEEALVELVIVRHLAAQHLDGDTLVDHLVAGSVDDAHPAFAEEAVDDVATVDGLADVRIDPGGRRHRTVGDRHRPGDRCHRETDGDGL